MNSLTAKRKEEHKTENHQKDAQIIFRTSEMCFNLPSKYFSDCDSDSDTMDLNWQEIFGMYLLKMEHETKRALKMMSDDIERKGLTLNQTLKDSLLQMTNAR